MESLPLTSAGEEGGGNQALRQPERSAEVPESLCSHFPSEPDSPAGGTLSIHGLLCPRDGQDTPAHCVFRGHSFILQNAGSCVSGWLHQLLQTARDRSTTATEGPSSARVLLRASTAVPLEGRYSTPPRPAGARQTGWLAAQGACRSQQVFYL